MYRLLIRTLRPGKSNRGALERAWRRYYLTGGRRSELPDSQFPGWVGKPGLPPECEIAEVALQCGLNPWDLAEHLDWLDILSARVSARYGLLNQVAEKARQNNTPAPIVYILR